MMNERGCSNEIDWRTEASCAGAAVATCSAPRNAPPMLPAVRRPAAVDRFIAVSTTYHIIRGRRAGARCFCMFFGIRKGWSMIIPFSFAHKVAKLIKLLFRAHARTTHCMYATYRVPAYATLYGPGRMTKYGGNGPVLRRRISNLHTCLRSCRIMF
jgi:hypothetical protein